MGKGGRRVERGRFDPACAPGQEAVINTTESARCARLTPYPSSYRYLNNSQCTGFFDEHPSLSKSRNLFLEREDATNLTSARIIRRTLSSLTNSYGNICAERVLEKLVTFVTSYRYYKILEFRFIKEDLTFAFSWRRKKGYIDL